MSLCTKSDPNFSFVTLRMNTVHLRLIFQVLNYKKKTTFQIYKFKILLFQLKIWFKRLTIFFNGEKLLKKYLLEALHDEENVLPIV